MIAAFRASGSVEDSIESPNRKGGLTIKMMPINTRTTLMISTAMIGSLMNSLAKNTVNMGDVEDIIIQSANGKC